MAESSFQDASVTVEEHACGEYFMSSITLLAEPFLTGTRRKPDGKEPGPKYKAWREKYKAEIGKELRAKGFAANEIEKIVEEFFDALFGYVVKGKKGRRGMLKFIWKNIMRIFDARDAINKARKTVGDPPPFEE